MEAAGTRCQRHSMGKRCTATANAHLTHEIEKWREMLEHGSLVNSGAHLQCQEDPYLYTATSTRAATRKVEDAEYGGTRTVVLRRTTVLEVQMLVGPRSSSPRPRQNGPGLRLEIAPRGSTAALSVRREPKRSGGNRKKHMAVRRGHEVRHRT